MRARFLVVCAVAGLAACGKSQESGAGGGPGESASATTSATPTPAASSAAPATSAPAAGAAAAGATSWHGTYKSAPGTMTVAPAWKKGHWSNAPSGAGLGDGPITLAIDGATRRVTGTVDGPLGTATIDGVADEGKLTASVARKDPSDRGFTGTLMATVAADKIEGTMNVVPGQAGELRTVTFTLSPAGR
jgi:hypothetical protein